MSSRDTQTPPALPAPSATGLVIGITGPVGSGVTTIAQALADNGFESISLSALIKKELLETTKLPLDSKIDESTIPDFRKKLQDIGNAKRKASKSHWVDVALAGVDGQRHVVVDGIRNLAEIEALRTRFHHQFFLLGVTADPAIRWERVKEQYNANQGHFDRDDRRDSNEHEEFGQQVAACVLESDFVFVNNADGGSSSARKAKLYGQFSDDVKLMQDFAARRKVGQRRTATKEEVNMATAIAHSHNSECLKRHVGAVIVDDHNLTISAGYNENPIRMLPCVAAYGHCYKDELMHKKLESLRGTRCTTCGERIVGLTPPWYCAKCGDNLKTRLFPSRNMEFCTAIHAEERAIRSLGGRDANGCTIYTSTFPCFQCARSIVDVGIGRVVYVEAYPVKESLDFLKKNKVQVDAFHGFKARAFLQIFRQID